ncbi:tRNA guanosine(34) transglycosylase Tgt [Patescibacteria group bacterium]|nr:tRNA guanosine(34) transglycosylase Tgt [Patescibacteria group bacterium]MBU1034820.1 tRNA guanosine(34) transglycosylase Tgt [Patescibacteria group bacterium]MBU1629616.1 tRNA guanosine(34) transglycosylase Tgt [Patescibacteria group bacterium]MBU1908103.1 tRNA guanosine(34) transglycosylase Tgt [Patescibacteria group bacterium]
MPFTVLKKSLVSAARLGTLQTPHGELRTPFFMPIATKGAVKTLSSFDIEKLGSPILLSNTYHLYLRPGLEVLKKFGGLHNFMSWNGALLTDSGGYQVFSLAKMRKIKEEGAVFASHIDGSRHLLTPELSMEIQRIIGSDIAMVLDECTPANSERKYLIDSLARTTRWAERSKQAFEKGRGESVNPDARIFGIVQGGTDLELRVQHAKDLAALDFDGYAIGGLSVGEPFADACGTVAALDTVLPQDKPRYFMGGAQPNEIIEYVKRGVDMFDCVLPTRNARHGMLYRFVHDDLSKPDFYETVHVTNEKWKMSDEPLAGVDSSDEISHELSRYSYAYLRHLFTVDEILALRLATMVNVRFYLELMDKIRNSIGTIL